jgi:hypothetical protein
MIKKVLGDVASWCWPYFPAKSSDGGVDVEGLACHHPTTCSHHTAVPSYRVRHSMSLLSLGTLGARPLH